MPRVFASFAEAANAEGLTHYRLFVGSGTAFDNAEGVARSEIRDGMSETIACVEVRDAVVWTKPEDLPYAADAPLPPLGGFAADRFLAVFCNGEVRRAKSASVSRSFPP